MAQDMYTECVNGELNVGDLVLSTPRDEYGCLIGTVLEINKLNTPKHEDEVDNGTDHVHVNFFDVDYSDKRVKEIEAMMSKLCFQEMEFGNCPLDDVIMAPDCLIRITGIEYEKLCELTDSRDNAIDFCNHVFHVRKLTDRLNQNLNEFQDLMQTLDKMGLIHEAALISAVSDTHFYLTQCHDFSDSEVEYLMQFEKPLDVVAEKWYEHVGQMEDFPAILDDVFDKEDAIEGGYELYNDPDLVELSKDRPMDKDIREAARHEAQRLLYEIKSLKIPNHPGMVHYSARISPEFIKLAGARYEELLRDAFQPPMPMLFSKCGQREGEYLSMQGSVRAKVKVTKAPIKEQLSDAAEKAAEYNGLKGSQKSKDRGGEIL